MERIAPLAKILAEANGIEWQKLSGTGEGGQIVEQDILNYLSRVMSGEEDPPDTPVDPTPPDWTGEDLPGGGMFDASALSQAGIDSDIAEFVEQSKPAAGAPTAGTAAAGFENAADEFELDDQPEDVAAAASSVPSVPAGMPDLSTPPANAPTITPSAAAPVTPTPPPPPVVPVPPAAPPAAPVPPAPTPAAPPQPAQGGGLGSLLSRLYQGRAKDNKEQPAPAPAAPTPPAAPPTPPVAPAVTAPTEPVIPPTAPPIPPVPPVSVPPTPPVAEVAEVEPAPAAEPTPPVVPPPAEPVVSAVPTPPVPPTPPVAEVVETPEPAPAEPVSPAPEPVEVVPVEQVPAQQPASVAASVEDTQPVQPVAQPRDSVWFGAYLRRSVDAVAVSELCEQLGEVLDRDVPAALLVARAAVQHLGLFEGKVNSVALRDPAVGKDHTVRAGTSLRDAVADLDQVHEGPCDLLIVNAAALDLDDVHYPDTVTLCLGRTQDGKATLSLNGDVEATQAAQFLSQVAKSLEKPVALVI